MKMHENKNSPQSDFNDFFASEEHGLDHADPMQGFLAQLAKEADQRRADQVADAKLRGGHAPRVAELHNTLDGNYITPDSAVVQEIEKETAGKVRYMARDIERIGLGGNFESRFQDTILAPIVEDIQARFPDKTIALRGVATSINGLSLPGAGDDLVLRDIVDTVEQGSEKPGEVFNVAVLNPEDVTSVHRVTQYAAGVGLKRKRAGESAQADVMFPAILVYDVAGLERAGGAYAVSFRKDREPADVLLAGYVVDCPAL